MIKVENIEVMNFEGTIRGARNPLNSWDKSDSYTEGGKFYIGSADLALLKRLYRAGPSHRKYLRQIFVSMDITAPLYWWKEMDQYKVGTVTNSCSTMHTITKGEITLSNFSIDNIEDAGEYTDSFKRIVDDCERLRKAFNTTKDPQYWRWLIQLLPESWNQKRTITMNYENVVSMIEQRSNHKLSEWLDFCDVLRSLPCIKEIMEESK